MTHAAGAPGTRGERPTEGARRAREHEATDAGGEGLLEQVERARDVRVHEGLPVVGGDVRLVQCRRVQDGVDALDAPPNESSVDDRPDRRGVWRVEDVEADYLLPL